MVREFTSGLSETPEICRPYSSKRLAKPEFFDEDSVPRPKPLFSELMT
jgi:hypothetical protein